MSEPETKVCKCCHVDLPITMYQWARKGRRRGTCRPCFNEKYKVRIKAQAKKNKKTSYARAGHVKREMARRARIAETDPARSADLKKAQHESRMKNLPESYIRQLLKAKHDVPEEIIEAKRLHVLIKRICDGKD